MKNRLQEIKNGLKSITELNNIFKGDITEKHICKIYEVDIQYLLDALERAQMKVDILEESISKWRDRDRKSQNRERFLREALETLIKRVRIYPNSEGANLIISMAELRQVKQTLSHDTQPKPLTCQYCNKSFNSIGPDDKYEHNWVNCRSRHGGVNP